MGFDLDLHDLLGLVPLLLVAAGGFVALALKRWRRRGR
jgi:hypothetical protein